MTNKKELKEQQLNKVSGGADIKNASDKTDEEYKKEDLEREINRLQQILNSGGQSYKEALELMTRITNLLRELQGYEDENNIIKNR